MKRLLCVLLCLCLTVFMLVGCAEEEIGSFLENYPEINDSVEEITLKVYLIAQDGTQKLAIDTVEQKLNQYSQEQFNTILDLEYFTEAEYTAKVESDTAQNSTTRPDIILVTSADMLEGLVTADKVADLSSYFDTKTYGSLNVQITSTILAAAKIDGKLYCVPNNHVVGEYEYLLVDKAVARSVYFSDESIAEMKSYDDTAALREKVAADFPGVDLAEAVKTVSGKYEDLAAYKAQGYHCNVMKYPTVDKYEALSSSFAVVKGTKDVNRCMEIIHAFNTNSDFRNTLQYGVEGANYTLDEQTGVVTRVTEGDNVYIMNIEHTGDVFKAYPCSDFAWTAEAISNGKLQNSESVLAQ